MKNSKISSIILWSLISAAFIGPGTVTTAVSAGSRYHSSLLWTIIFAVLACIVVQEIAARITIASGLNLGEAFAIKFGGRNGHIIRLIAGWTVIAGCAAFEAGNIAGAVSGINLFWEVSPTVAAGMLCVVAIVILRLNKINLISGIMLGFVAVMGMAFIFLAFRSDVSGAGLMSGIITPGIPSGADLLVIGLIGTTIVPYNLFLGSGISHHQSISLMRTGLVVSVCAGGAITAAVLIAGTLISEFNSFSELGRGFRKELGPGGQIAFSSGLLAAGFSSAITAPLAASVIGSTMLSWSRRQAMAAWLMVVVIGFLLAVSGFKPIPLILVVQALNGAILPVIVLCLLIIVNDTRIVPISNKPSWSYNLLIATILMVITVISGNIMMKAMSALF